MKHKFTSEQEHEIARRYRAGESTTIIAESVGASARGVNNILHRLGIEMRPVRPTVTDDQRKLAIEACLNGNTIAEAATLVGISESVISRALREQNIGLPRGPERKLSIEQEAAIVVRYKAGEDMREIADSLNIGTMTIQRTIARQGVEARYRSLTPDEENTAVEMAANGANLETIGSQFGVDKSTIWSLMKRRGISMPHGRPVLYTANDAALDTITPEAAYWIGFLWADGCISRTEGCIPKIICGLAEKDRRHLEKMRTFFGSNAPLRNGVVRDDDLGGPIVYLRVRSEQLCSKLESFGFAKKRTRVPCAELAASRDFWRGAMDGDGSIGIYAAHSGYFYPHFDLAGQVPLLETFRTFLHDNKLTDRLTIRPGVTVPRIGTSGSTARAIIECLYWKASTFLDRKMERAIEIIAGSREPSKPFDEGPSSVVVPENEEYSED